MLDLSGITMEQILKGAPIAITAGVVSYMVLRSLFKKVRCCDESDVINKSVEKDKAKVVHSFDMEDLPDKVSFCRCWKSSKFPYCDGSHNAHNKLTGDNVAPVCLNRKVPSGR